MALFAGVAVLFAVLAAAALIALTPGSHKTAAVAGREPPISIRVTEAPAYAYLEQPFRLTIEIVNPGSLPVRNAVVTVRLPPAVRLIAAVPEGLLVDGAITWPTVDLAAGEVDRLDLSLFLVDHGGPDYGEVTIRVRAESAGAPAVTASARIPTGRQPPPEPPPEPPPQEPPLVQPTTTATPPPPTSTPTPLPPIPSPPPAAPPTPPPLPAIPTPQPRPAPQPSPPAPIAGPPTEVPATPTPTPTPTTTPSATPGVPPPAPASADDGGIPLWVVGLVAAGAGAALLGGAAAYLLNRRNRGPGRTVPGPALPPPSGPCSGRCDCSVEIVGPAVFYRHWDPRLGPGRGNAYVQPACYEVKVELECEGMAKPPYSGTARCRPKWDYPDEWKEGGRVQMLGDKVCFLGAPPSVLEDLRKSDQHTFTLQVVVECPYTLCTQSEEWCSCRAEKSITIKNCLTARDEEQSEQECKKLEADLRHHTREADEAAAFGARARARLEFSVQVFGAALHGACRGYEEVRRNCNWAYALDTIQKIFDTAGDIAETILAGITGGASEVGIGALEAAAEYFAEKAGAAALGAETEDCDVLLARWRNRLVELKIKACEGARGFGDVVRTLDRKERELGDAIKRAEAYRGCTFCDQDDALRDARAALERLHRELLACIAARNKYRAWIDFCDRNRGYTPANAYGICSDAPAVPPQ